MGKHFNETHGMTGTKVYKAWISAKNRCLNERDVIFPKYGGRGIKFCERWMSFEDFYADVGDPPTCNHSIDRIDVNGDYCAENVRWATAKEQSNNKRNNKFLSAFGLRMTAQQWCDRQGFCRGLVNVRLRDGWSIEDAIGTPVAVQLNLTAFGETMPFLDWCAKIEIHPDTIRRRIKKGMSAEEALTKPVRKQREWRKK